MEINQGRPITFIDVEVVKEHRRAGLNWIDVCNYSSNYCRFGKRYYM